MKQELKLQLEAIMNLQEDFVKYVISNIWNEATNGRSININSYWLVELSDMFFWFDDFIVFAKYEIPKEIIYEWYDHISLSYTTDRVKDYLETIKEKDFKWTYLDFYRFTLKD